MIRRHYFSYPDEQISDFIYFETQFNVGKIKYFDKDEIDRRFLSIKNAESHLDIHSRIYASLFYDSIFLQKDIKIAYSSIFYLNLFGFLSYKRDFESDRTETVERFLSTGEVVQRNVREEKLLSHNLQDYLYTAILLRDKKAIMFYAGIMPRNSIKGHNNHLYIVHLEQLLIYLCQNDEDKIPAHLEIMQNTDYFDVMQINESSYEFYYFQTYLEYIFTPIIGVFKAIFKDNAIVFNEKLSEALLKHKSYYEADDEYKESRRGKPEGWVSLLLTCACAIAHDKGMKREVESDYIPEWLVKGEFEGLELVVE